MLACHTAASRVPHGAFLHHLYSAARRTGTRTAARSVPPAAVAARQWRPLTLMTQAPCLIRLAGWRARSAALWQVGWAVWAGDGGSGAAVTSGTADDNLEAADVQTMLSLRCFPAAPSCHYVLPAVTRTVLSTLHCVCRLCGGAGGRADGGPGGPRQGGLVWLWWVCVCGAAVSVYSVLS